MTPTAGTRSGFFERLRSRGPYGALPPGPAEPAWLQTLRWVRTPTRFLLAARDRYGETFTMRLTGIAPFVSVSAPEIVRKVFTGAPDDLFAGEANVVLEPILGSNSLLLLDGEKHLRQRRLLLPPFHGARMRAYGEVMAEATLAAIERMPRDAVTPLHTHTQRITLDVILRAVFGVEDGPRLDALQRHLEALLEALVNPFFLMPTFRVDLGPRSPGGRLARLLADTDRLLFELIRARRAEGRAGREDILSILVEAEDEDGVPMSDQELRDELMTLLVAGHETTATSLAWTVYRLLRHPVEYERLLAELDTHRASGGEISPDVARTLPRLDAVIRETLRLQPVVPLVGRRLQRPLSFDGLQLPRGVVIVPNIFLTHRNPRVWSDPERFVPDRMMEGRPSPHAFFPFGGGVRRCIGMAFALYEMQVVLATMLTRVRFRPVAGYRMKLVRRSITFAPSEGLPVRVLSR